LVSNLTNKIENINNQNFGNLIYSIQILSFWTCKRITHILIPCIKMLLILLGHLQLLVKHFFFYKLLSATFAICHASSKSIICGHELGGQS
jgi:hypothetical protein